MTSVESRIAVIGAGVVGLSTAYALTERGVPVTVYESGLPGNGQSAGESRIFRHLHDDLRLTRLARESRAVWQEWGGKLGVELLAADGHVALGQKAADRLQVLEELGGVPARRIAPTDLLQWLPLLADYPETAVLDETAGTIRAGAAIEALTGAVTDSLVSEEVMSLRPTSGGEVEVRTGGGSHVFSRVVVCAGRQTAVLANDMGVTLPVKLGLGVRLTFEVASEPPVTLACLQDGSGYFGETGAYGVPLPGYGTYAVGLSEVVDARPDGSLLDPDGPASLGIRVCDYVARALPGLEPEPLEVRHCWVTTLPWSHDAMAVWELDGALFTAGNNMFKHAPVLGRRLASAALGEEITDELLPSSRLGEPL
jgi:sarcosine oxidase